MDQNQTSKEILITKHSQLNEVICNNYDAIKADTNTGLVVQVLIAQTKYNIK